MKFNHFYAFDAGYISNHSPASYAAQSDAAIKKAIISESIRSYPGLCACPYNSTRNGSSCGRRSAYSKPGGYSPVCYPEDVTSHMIDAYRERIGEK